MKKAALTGMVLILVLLLLPSCGVSTEEYARVSSDLAAAQKENEALEKEIETLQVELDAKENELEATNEILTEVGARLAFVEAVDIPILKGDIPDELILQFYKQCMIVLSDDPVLVTKYDTFLSSWTMEAFIDFHSYLLVGTLDVIE